MAVRLTSEEDEEDSIQEDMIPDEGNFSDFFLKKKKNYVITSFQIIEELFKNLIVDELIFVYLNLLN